MKMLILGDNGLLGAPLLRQLCAAGHEVFLLSSVPLDTPAQGTLVRGDRAHLARYASHLRGLRPDVVIDLAARTTADAQTLLELFDNIAWRIVLASTFQVYEAWAKVTRAQSGDVIPADITEESPLVMHDGAAESALQQANSQWVIVRLPYVYGPGDSQQLVWQFVHQVDLKRPYILLSPALANWRVSFCYSENAAHALALAATHDDAENQIYNVAEQTTEPVGEWAHRVVNAASYRGKVLVAPQKHCPPHLLHPEFDFRHDIALDTRKIRQQLGFAEIVPLRDALKATIAHDRAAALPYNGPFPPDFAAEDAMLKKLGLL